MSKDLNELPKTEAATAEISEAERTSKGTHNRHSSRQTRKKSRENSGSQSREETGPVTAHEHTGSSVAIFPSKPRRRHSHGSDSFVITPHSTDGVHDSRTDRSKKKKHTEPVDVAANEPEDKAYICDTAQELVKPNAKKPSIDLEATAPHMASPKANEANTDMAPTAVSDGQRHNPDPSVTAAARGITAKHDSAPGHSRDVPTTREASTSDGVEELVPERQEVAGKPRRWGTGSLSLSKINIALGLSAAGVLLSIVALAWAGSQPHTVCNSSGCARFSRLFKASLNASAADPCDNFTAFVCAGWTRDNKYSVRQDLVVNALGALSILSRPSPANAKITTPAEGAMAFFRSCDAVLRGHVDQLPTVKRFLAEANITWPRRPNAPDVLQTLLYASVKLRWSPLFNIDIDASVDYGTDVFLMPFDDYRLVRRKFDSLERGSEHDRRAYFNFLRETFGSPEPEEGEVTYEEVSDMSNCMLVPLFESLQEQSTPEAVSTGLLLTHRANLTTSRWESVLALYGVTRTPIVYSTNALTYIVKFFELWDVHGEGKTHLLVSWCTIQVAALYANRELIGNYYGRKERALVEHGAFCLSKAYLIGKFSLFANYSLHLLKRDGRQDVDNIAHSVRQAFHSRLQDWKHYEPIRAVVADWDSTATVFSVFDAGCGNVTNDTQICTDMGESLPENWRKAAIPMKTMRSDKVYSAMQSFGLHVVLYNDFILLPFSASFPLYLVNATDAVKYGGVGKEMALSLSSLFYDTYRLFREANYSIANVSKCMGGPGALRNNLEALAIEAVYDAYVNASAERDVRLVGLEKYTASQIFFIASCYATCPGSMESRNEDCNAALRHVEAFSIAFRCPSKSFMNPRKTCHLF